MDKETLIRIAEELHQGAFDAKAYYLIMQQYRKNQHNYAEEMKVSPAFYHTVYDARRKPVSWRLPNCMIARMVSCPLEPSLLNARKTKTFSQSTERNFDGGS